jgi:hypothetical protein
MESCLRTAIHQLCLIDVFVYDQSTRMHEKTSEAMVFDQALGVNDSSVGSTISGVYVYGSG